MKDETRGVAIEEFVGFKPKMYSLLLLYRDLSEDIYLMDHSTVFHTINKC